MKLFLIFSITTLLIISGCSRNNNFNSDLDYLSKHNVILKDLSKNEYKVVYSVSEYNELVDFYENHDCYERITKSEYSEFINFAFSQEVLSLADDNKAGILEKYKGDQNFSLVLNYLTGSVQYFANPTKLTRNFSKKYDDMIDKSVKSIPKNQVDSFHKDKKLMACVMFDTLLGAVGYKTVFKEKAKSLADVASRDNLNKLRETLQFN